MNRKTPKQVNESTKVSFYSKEYDYGTQAMYFDGKVCKEECIERVKHSGLFRFLGDKEKGDWLLFRNGANITKDATGETKNTIRKDEVRALVKKKISQQDKQDNKKR